MSAMTAADVADDFALLTDIKEALMQEEGDEELPVDELMATLVSDVAGCPAPTTAEEASDLAQLKTLIDAAGTEVEALKATYVDPTIEGVDATWTLEDYMIYAQDTLLSAEEEMDEDEEMEEAAPVAKRRRM